MNQYINIMSTQPVQHPSLTNIIGNAFASGPWMSQENKMKYGTNNMAMFGVSTAPSTASKFLQKRRCAPTRLAGQLLSPSSFHLFEPHPLSIAES